MTYAATITSASLRLRESRVVADLLLRAVDRAEWCAQIYDRNVLQIASKVGLARTAGLLRARLEPMGPSLWQMVRDGSTELACQATLAGAIHHSRLLGDFMDIALREQRALFAKFQTGFYADPKDAVFKSLGVH